VRRASRPPHERSAVMDVVYLALIGGFFLLTLGLVRLCERV
jgi:hypothetical protein